MSPDLPFVFRQGDDELTALHNRIGALERIKFLTGVDLKERSTEYKQLIDCELYVKFYKDLPTNIPIDEEFCQRTADIVRILEKEKKEDLDKTLEAVPERVKQLHAESLKKVPAPQPLNIPERKGWIVTLKNLFPKKV